MKLFNLTFRPGLGSWRGDPRRAFTMIEIAISLAVIGFALVAIIGILPTGMNVQRENREETIINQDASIFINAIRNGAHGADDLTNYVTAIRRHVTEYETPPDSRTPATPVGPMTTLLYTNSIYIPGPPYVQYPLTNGQRIIGLMSTPKYLPYRNPQRSGFFSNYIVAYVRSMSGMASEKAPQNNQDVLDFAFSYRVITESVPYAAYHPWWTNINPADVQDTNTIALHSNYWNVARNIQGNLHDMRLTFRWPVLPGNKLGEGRQTFRTMMSGGIRATNDVQRASLENTLYFYDHPRYALITNAP